MNKIIIALLTSVISMGATWSVTVYAGKPDNAEKINGEKAQKQLPKGLQKKLDRGDELPPGWHKKIQKGERLSPELRASSEPVSEEIRLAIEDGDQIASEIIRIQDKVIRVSKGQGTVIDVIDIADILVGGGIRQQKQ